MDSELRRKLIRQRAVAKTSLTRLQNFIAAAEHKVSELQVRYDELPTIYTKYDNAQNELEISDDDDLSMDRELFGNQYYEIKARLFELLHPIESPNLDNSTEQNVSNSVSTRGNAQISLPTIELPTFSGDACKWLHFRDTFQTLVIDNNTLSDIQKFHYLISSLKDEAKMLIANLPVTLENFFGSLEFGDSTIQQCQINCNETCQAINSHATSQGKKFCIITSTHQPCIQSQ
jgi:hypothetical protein